MKIQTSYLKILSPANLVIAASFCFASVGFAASFSEADALYARRAEGKELIQQAKDAYSSQLSASNREEKIYAVDRLSRLAYYEGLITPESQNDERKVFFKRCWDDLENLISPALVGETPEYFYWKGVCMAQFAKANGIASSLAKSGELVQTIERGIEIANTFEGGGFHRLGAAVYQNLPPVNPFGPTYDINKSLQYADLAISSDAYVGATDPDTATGDYFYNVYEYKSLALARIGDREGARATLEEAIARIEQGDVPADRVAETQAFLEILRRALADL